MPLVFAKIGQIYKIVKITGKDDVRNHLANLGFVEGVQISIVSEMAGNYIINVRDTRVALDKTLAKRIMI